MKIFIPNYWDLGDLNTLKWNAHISFRPKQVHMRKSHKNTYGGIFSSSALGFINKLNSVLNVACSTIWELTGKAGYALLLLFPGQFVSIWSQVPVNSSGHLLTLLRFCLQQTKQSRVSRVQLLCDSAPFILNVWLTRLSQPWIITLPRG